MAKAEDLSKKVFGYLKVKEKSDDHVSKSGQKKVCWLCECQLCGNEKVVTAQDLKRGTIISCGCYQSYKGKQIRNKKICIICGKEFECPPSNKTVTCSNECRKEYAKQMILLTKSVIFLHIIFQFTKMLLKKTAKRILWNIPLAK